MFVSFQASEKTEKKQKRNTKRKSFGSVWNNFYASFKRKLKKLLWINKYEIKREREINVSIWIFTEQETRPEKSYTFLFVFEDYYHPTLQCFIQKNSKISHTGRIMFFRLRNLHSFFVNISLYRLGEQLVAHPTCCARNSKHSIPRNCHSLWGYLCVVSPR